MCICRIIFLTGASNNHGRGGGGLREYVIAPGALGKIFPRFGVAPRVGVKDSYSSVWPLEWSVTHKRGIL